MAGVGTSARVLARLRFHPRVAALRLELLHRPADTWWLVISASSKPSSSSRHHLALGQGRLLRLDLLVRRARRDAGRHAAPQDAARSVLESVQHGRARSILALAFAAAGLPHRRLESAAIGGGAQRSTSAVETASLREPGKRLVSSNYIWFVDLCSAGIIGVGLYFWFWGRVWCRFACPLAALMHIYARFSPLPHFRGQEKVHLLQRLHVASATRASTS